ncbi:hypothetical protein SBA5_160036 [Candidatus Sulfotelmatomonas gaucii]|uniref:Uncharacterized protein n=1 Tax=Candidatus Sulfuritelmatomonas gaucii TaxID=2043161 RepID=A0A2N9L5H9_9BACT|nr:hypothetical protein SBA5_160036 [Candidatus Sulfotelmatomonas gaucii]
MVRDSGFTVLGKKLCNASRSSRWRSFLITFAHIGIDLQLVAYLQMRTSHIGNPKAADFTLAEETHTSQRRKSWRYPSNIRCILESAMRAADAKNPQDGRRRWIGIERARRS